LAAAARATLLRHRWCEGWSASRLGAAVRDRHSSCRFMSARETGGDVATHAWSSDEP